MKNFLQNLLIFFALCLCGLVAVQWHRETKLQQQIQRLSDAARDKVEATQSIQSALNRAEEEVKRLDALKNGLNELVKSNQVRIARLQSDLERADTETGKNLKQIDAYKSALEQANANIRKQNEDLKRLAAERNEAATKFNKLVEDYNALAQKWSELNAPNTATNSPPKK